MFGQALLFLRKANHQTHKDITDNLIALKFSIVNSPHCHLRALHSLMHKRVRMMVGYDNQFVIVIALVIDHVKMVLRAF